MAEKLQCACGRKGTRAALTRHSVSCGPAGEAFRAGRDPIGPVETIDRTAVMVARLVGSQEEHRIRQTRWRGIRDPLGEDEE